MQLILVNTTASTKTYLSGAISVAGNSTTAVTNTVQQLSLSIDGSLILDILSNYINISDGSNTYSNTDAIQYLQLVPMHLVPISDTYGNGITSTAASGKQALDVNLIGNLVNENGDLSTSDELRTFNSQSKVFSSQTPVILVGTAETALFLFRNPNGSGKTIKIFRFAFGGTGTFKMYYLPTITSNGTTVGPLLRKVTSGAQGNSGLTTSSPAASANGTLADVWVTTGQSQNLFDYPSYVILPANTSILITAAMVANNTNTTARIEWAEL